MRPLSYANPIFSRTSGKYHKLLHYGTAPRNSSIVVNGALPAIFIFSRIPRHQKLPKEIERQESDLFRSWAIYQLPGDTLNVPSGKTVQHAGHFVPCIRRSMPWTRKFWTGCSALPKVRVYVLLQHFGDFFQFLLPCGMK